MSKGPTTIIQKSNSPLTTGDPSSITKTLNNSSTTSSISDQGNTKQTLNETEFKKKMDTAVNKALTYQKTQMGNTSNVKIKIEFYADGRIRTVSVTAKQTGSASPETLAYIERALKIALIGISISPESATKSNPSIIEKSYISTE